jgi:DNA-binding NarL/FixJ family response regulator
MRVLLADDAFDVRSALKLLLEQEPGVIVSGEVTNYRELVARVNDLRPDLVLLDWELPGERGSEFLRTIGRDFPGTLVVVLSSQPDIEKRALAEGAFAFASKGEPPERLLSLIRRLNDPGGMPG